MVFQTRGGSKENIKNTWAGKHKVHSLLTQIISARSLESFWEWVMCHTGWCRERWGQQGGEGGGGGGGHVSISLQRSLLPLNPAAEFFLILFLWVCWAVVHRERERKRDRSHLEQQPWGQTRRQPTPQEHRHTNTHSSMYVQICCCAVAPKRVCCSHLTHYSCIRVVLVCKM